MKEGQYYMTPLYLICLPLIFLTLAPGIELNLFYSLVPVTGVSLLLRALILGDYDVAWRFFLPVLVPTVVYGAVALRWAIDQFQREDVLFREAERFDLRIWVRHLLRDKEPTPNGGEALFCFALMLTLAWFMIQYLRQQRPGHARPGRWPPARWRSSSRPPLAMAVLLTSSPRRTLRLYWPQAEVPGPGRRRCRWRSIPLVNDAAADRRDAVPDLAGDPGDARPDDGERPEPGRGDPPVRPRPRHLRGAGVPRLHPHRPGARAPHADGHPPVGAAVRVPARPAAASSSNSSTPRCWGSSWACWPSGAGASCRGSLFHFINNALAIVMGTLAGDPARRRFVAWLYRDPAKGLYHWWWVVLGALGLGRAAGLALARVTAGPAAGRAPRHPRAARRSRPERPAEQRAGP